MDYDFKTKFDLQERLIRFLSSLKECCPTFVLVAHVSYFAAGLLSNNRIWHHVLLL